MLHSKNLFSNDQNKKIAGSKKVGIMSHTDQNKRQSMNCYLYHKKQTLNDNKHKISTKTAPKHKERQSLQLLLSSCFPWHKLLIKIVILKNTNAISQLKFTIQQKIIWNIEIK